MTNEPAPGPADETPCRPGDSILESIARRTGRAPRVNLLDAGTAGETPILDPKAHAYQNELSATDQGKYRILGEIARGGMGVVLRGHDIELGRDIAIKVTDGELAKRPEVIERFVEEAQIGGQLQHPGIVPVYELGLMADQRPYFTMKLIKGRTLAAMLTRRKSVEEDRVRFLDIWESVCQTMAYAHSKGVIHRDLKPANIMVGAFGEVQVVDWGLSKVLRRGGVADEVEARDTAMSVIETVRSGSGSGSDSIVGSVLGTPAYMSPEQAQGEPDKLDERTDVFALGAILCEILTGAPPYVAGGGQNLVQMAAFGELDAARARIDACSAAPDLKRLCLASLMTARAARPRDAEELANAVHAHLAGLESRAHEAQLAAAEERVRAERSRRRLQLTLSAGAVLALVAGGFWFLGTQRRERIQELSVSLGSIGDDSLSLAREGDFARAVEVARGGLRLVEAAEATPELRTRAERLVAAAEEALHEEEQRLAEAERERTLFDFLLDVEIRQVSTGFVETDEELERQYEAAFAAYGFDVEAENIGERLAALRDTDLGVRLALGFDGWSRLLRRMGAARDFKQELLTGIGIDLDTEPLRTTIRWALVGGDKQQLLELARDLDVDTTSPETLALLASSLSEFRLFEEARSLFVRGANRHPTSFLLNFGAGSALYQLDRDSETDSFEGAVGYLRAALALRSDLVGLHVQMGDLYRSRGHVLLSVRHVDQAVRRAPDHRWNDWVIGWTHWQAGNLEEALVWYERAVANSGGDWELVATHALEVTLGRAPFEEFLAWCEVDRTKNMWKTIQPGRMLVFPGQSGLEPDPARALDLLERALPEGYGHGAYWSALLWAYLAVGNLERALEVIEQGREFEDDLADQQRLSLRLLRDATVARLQGEVRTQRSLLEQARWVRAQLMAGMEEEWRGTAFHANFEYLERIAQGE
ncbi:MAG: protein kinase [Planctomycetota bacterium]